jgi:phosphatase NudJ
MGVKGRQRIPSSFFVFVVVEHQGRVLLVRERKHGQRWYAPAGGLEPGETIWEAAVRETMEEAGVLVAPTAVVRIEQEWHPTFAACAEGEGDGVASWWRFVMRARPVGATTPKSRPDEHTLEARWVTPAEIATFALRHEDVLELVTTVVSGEARAGATPQPRPGRL